MEKAIAIIPARGGSKRIPRKNIKNFAGQPVIKYSIDAAFDSGCFNEVMVSTDDEEIAELSKKLGANVPFLRSKENSDDVIGTAPVLEEVLREYRKRGQEFYYVCCLYPTNPFITPEKILLAHNLLLNSSADGVIAIVRSSHPVHKALKIEGGAVKMFWPENYSVRSQDLEPSYYDSNQLYFLKVQSLLEQKTLYPKFTTPLIISELEAQDINTEEDWKIAEFKFGLVNHG